MNLDTNRQELDQDPDSKTALIIRVHKMIGTAMSFTGDQLLRLNKKELEKIIQDAVPSVTGVAFTPDIIRPTNNVIRVEVNHLKADWQRKVKKNFKIQTVAIPAFILLPAGAFFFLPVDHATIPAFWFVGSIILVLLHLFFTGRISGWRTKAYDTHATTATKESERLVLQRASEWARQRYVLPPGNVEWSAYGSEFRLGEKVYVWQEVESINELDAFVLQEVETGNEPELRK